jgi:hypothetical protein
MELIVKDLVRSFRMETFTIVEINRMGSLRRSSSIGLDSNPVVGDVALIDACGRPVKNMNPRTRIGNAGIAYRKLRGCGGDYSVLTRLVYGNILYSKVRFHIVSVSFSQTYPPRRIVDPAALNCGDGPFRANTPAKTVY